MEPQGSPPRDGWRGRAFALVIALIAAAGLLGVGMILTSSFSASQVAGQARQLHWTNATLGTIGIARAATAQAVFFSYETDVGGPGTTSQDVAIDEALLNLAAVEELLGAGSDADATTLALLEDFVAAGQETIGLANIGEAEAAEAIRLMTLEPLYGQIETELGSQQSDLAHQIALSEASASRVNQLAQLVLMLVVPGAVIVIFWLVLRRKARGREIQIQARVDEQRRMNTEKDQFIAGLSHELRTPLTSIYGFSEVLLDEGNLDNESSELIALINAGSADLSRMVDDLLAAARLDAEALTSRPQKVDLAEQATAVAAPYLRADEKIGLRLESTEVYADALHVRQIIHNLVSNARRHGGEDIIVSVSERGGKANLVVADDGPGVSPEAEARLFERFSNKGREPLVAGSVGLGLSISQELAMRMGGTLRYERIDDWTTFTLRLPLLPSVDLQSSAEVGVFGR